MSFLSRYLGQADEDDTGDEGLVIANPEQEDGACFGALFPDAFDLDVEQMLGELQSYHPSMAEVQCEFEVAPDADGKLLGLVGWGRHVIRCVGFDAPLAPEVVELCVAPAHYREDLKVQARESRAHFILMYAGFEAAPLEQMVALAAVAGVLARLGASIVLNESGHASIPAGALAGRELDGDDALEFLRCMPLPLLYCGFVKYEVEDVPGVWMRTHGAGELGLPNLAVHADGYEKGQHYFDVFDNILNYLLESGAELSPGHTLQIAEEVYLRFRELTEEEEYLDGNDNLLVAEEISANDVN